MNDELREFADLVGHMLIVQQEYFRTQSPEALTAAKKLEKQVYARIRVIKSGQIGLFDRESI